MIDWVTIFLFAGMLPVATAMDKSGAGKLIANWVVASMGGSPGPLLVTTVLFALSAGLTQFMSNTGSTALLAHRPIRWCGALVAISSSIMSRSEQAWSSCR